MLGILTKICLTQLTWQERILPWSENVPLRHNIYLKPSSGRRGTKAGSVCHCTGCALLCHLRLLKQAVVTVDGKHSAAKCTGNLLISRLMVFTQFLQQCWAVSSKCGATGSQSDGNIWGACVGEGAAWEAGQQCMSVLIQAYRAALMIQCCEWKTWMLYWMFSAAII